MKLFHKIWKLQISCVVVASSKRNMKLQSVRKLRRKKRESVTGQIHDVTRQTEAVKSTTDALQKQTTSVCDKAEDSGSDTHALVTQRKVLTKDNRREKKAGARNGRS